MMRRYCPNCKQLIDGGTTVCPHCFQPLSRLISVNVKRSNTTVPNRSAWDKLRQNRRKFRRLKELYILGLLAMVLTLFFGNWRLVIVGFVIGSVALLFMALSVVDIKWKAKRPAKLLYDHKDEQVNNWLEALAKKDHKV
jgi:hypothetical protein